MAALGLEQRLLNAGLEHLGGQGHETKSQQGCTRSPAQRPNVLGWRVWGCSGRPASRTGSSALSTGNKEAEVGCVRDAPTIYRR